MGFLLFIYGAQLTMLTYLGWRVASEPWHWLFLGTAFLFSALLPLYHHHLRRHPDSVKLAVMQQLTYLCMGILSVLFGLTVVRDVLFFVWREFALEIGDTQLILLATAFTVLGLMRGWSGPRVREVRVPIKDLPSGLEGMRIVQISDLHIGASIGARYVNRVVRLTEKLRPDLTVLTGDIVDGAWEKVRGTAALLGRLAPSSRVFYSLGNHEYYWGVNRHLPELEGFGLSVLNNRGTTLDHGGSKVWVAGISDPVAGSFDRDSVPSVTGAAAGGGGSAIRILLSHRPHFVEEASRAGFDLQLSGHTHGGQFFPWNIVARFFHRYFVGLMKFERTWIYVNPGTGSWGPLLRLGTTPEITLLRLSRQ